MYVLDGGALIQRLPQPSGLTYDIIYDLYFKYVCQKHGTDSIVVLMGMLKCHLQKTQLI